MLLAPGELDTIFALATPPGRSALAVIRISGSSAISGLEVLAGAKLSPRRPSLRVIRDLSGQKIDEAIVTLFPGPKSFTGEDCVELSVHGGRSVVATLVKTLSGLPGFRSADPGEFTRRAFLNGRIDLTQAEAIVDLIDSETEFQRRQALRVMSGELRDLLQRWSDSVLEMSAEVEGTLDFSDEGDVDTLDIESLCSRAELLASELESELSKASRSLNLRDGFTVAIAGPPNAGKSTLFNQLVGEEAAIVASVPGTTRDIVARALDFDGVPVKLLDTAGLRETTEEVEAIGVDRALAACASADLIIELLPPDLPTHTVGVSGNEILRVFSMVDLRPAPAGEIGVSRHDPASIDRLRAEISRVAVRSVGDGSEGRLIRQRHVCALSIAASSLRACPDLLRKGYLELAAEELRSTREAFGSLIGVSGPEDVLGEIFGRFCIGK